MPCGLLPVGSRQVPRCLSASAHRQGDLRENQGLVMRECLQRGNVKKLDAAGIPHMANPSHIVPVMVCDPMLCKQISDTLLARYGIYVQPINYPTVAKGTERLRITPSPLHSDEDIEHLVASLSAIWSEIGLSRAA